MRIATSDSLILRSQLRLPTAKPISSGRMLRVSCCVMVLPPGERPRVAMSRSSASTMREILKPLCSKNPESSAARIAWRRCGEMSL